jgi:hypothetical protein
VPSFAVLKVSKIAMSTRLIMDVRIVPGWRWFWFESTPMASLPLSLAAWSTPRPVAPAAA